MQLAGRAFAPFLVTAILAGSCVVFFSALVILDAVKRFVPIAFVQDVDFAPLVILPIGIVAINAALLIVESLNVGWKRSALKRLLFLETETVRNDLFYLVLRVSGFNYLFAFLLSFGLIFFVTRELGHRLDLDLLAPVDSLAFQFVAIVLVNSFVFYWAHRFMHTRGMFEIHKVHHSALELNVLTPTRNHPVDFMIMLVINTVPAAMLGADGLVVTAYLGLNGLYQCAVHSEITFLEYRPIRLLIVTPRVHKVHHSREEEHYDKNFGILTLWDYLFGTYHYPAPERAITMGLHNDDAFNTDHYLREMWGVFGRWITGLTGLAGKRADAADQV